MLPGVPAAHMAQKKLRAKLRAKGKKKPRRMRAVIALFLAPRPES